MTMGTLESRLCKLELQKAQFSPGSDMRLPDWLAVHWRSGPSAIPTAGRISQYQALPAQQKFHSDLVTRFKGYSGPIGSGKSYALVYEALFLSYLNPGLVGLVGAPTYRML